jgi:hypothetical protein
MTVVDAKQLRWRVLDISKPAKAKDAHSCDWVFQIKLTDGETESSGVVEVPVPDIEWLKGLAADESTNVEGIVQKFLDRVLRGNRPLWDDRRITLSKTAYLGESIGH